MTGNKDNTNVTREKTTKERIFEVAIDFFAQKGFDATSTREIAEAVGIKQASLYNHYKNKEAIMDSIIEYLLSEFAQNLPSEEVTDELISQGPDVFFKVITESFIGSINTPTMEKIWRIISIEMYHNEKIRNMFKKNFFEDTINMAEYIFAKMIEKKVIKPFNPRTLAREYYLFGMALQFEYFVLNYNEDCDSFMDLVLEKMIDHAEFLLEAIKI